MLAGAEVAEDSSYDLARSREELQEIYTELQSRKGGKKEIVDRILEGDWRNGLSLRQLAMVDVQYLLDHPTSQRWTALKLVRSALETKKVKRGVITHTELPRIHGPTFLKHLQSAIGPLIKAHYHLVHLNTLPITLLRLSMFNTPYNTQGSVNSQVSLESSTSIYVAFPDGAPYAYISFGTQTGPTGTSGKVLRKFVVDSIPKALSRPGERYTLKSTSFSAKSLSALIAVRGTDKHDAAGGGWSIFAENATDKNPLASTPLDTSGDEDKENDPTIDRLGKSKEIVKKRPRSGDLESSRALLARKRQKWIAKCRFGPTLTENDQRGIERFSVKIEDPFSSTSSLESISIDETAAFAVRDRPLRKGRRSTISIFDEDDESQRVDKNAPKTWSPGIEVTFHGAHVFTGIRKLVENGVIDGERLPGWMTGEEGVSNGVVSDRRIRGFKGSGV